MTNRTGTEPDIPIIHEDPHLLVVDKPHGVLSQGDRTGDPSVVELCRDYLQRSGSGNPFVGLVHRLDRPVGGLMMVAKSRKAAEGLSKQINDRLLQKTYWCVVTGSPPVNGMLTHHLRKDRDRNTVTVSDSSDRDARQAVLSFARLQNAGSHSLLTVHLQTGRPHQIRVQLSAEGYPVWGDYRYGPPQPDGRTIALRAVELRFRHPVTGKELHFHLPPPRVEPWNAFDLPTVR